MTNNDNIGHSPEQFEQWFNNLPTDEQQAFMDRITRLSEPTPYDITDRDMFKRLVEQHGEVTSVHSEDLGDFGIFGDEPEFQFPPDETD